MWNIWVLMPERLAYNIADAPCIVISFILVTQGEKGRAMERTLEGLGEELRQTQELLQAEIVRRKEAEAELLSAVQGQERIMASMLDVFYLFDREGNLLKWNRKLEELTGLSAANLKGRHVLTFVSDADKPAVENAFKEVIETGYGWVEAQMIHKDGTLKPYYFGGAAVKDENDQVVGLAGIGRDISRQKLFEEKALEWTGELEAAHKAKDDFLANMSHELRTPLNAIIGFSDIMLQGMAGGLTDKQREFANDIYESGKHLLSIINDILDISKIDAGKMPAIYSAFGIKGLLDRSIVFVREDMLGRGIKLTTEVEDAEIVLEADERQIKQVLINLLSNAAKFTQDGGTVRVCVRKGVMAGKEEFAPASAQLKPGVSPYRWPLLTAVGSPKAQSPDRDFVEISVEDSGIGIKPEDIPRLFKHFQQLGSAYNKKYKGTGLGLALCKKIVELHGGIIWAESELGKGSRFIFTLPQKKITT